ncbi:hypothetical protein XA68_16818 [Ophiocordyceps unilateralis]|uniref:Uncharacterized protein n=1 Tax=Ophiocordyceps unilateralis TaxID=268505 RepID=A0A2A9PL73_OPHUN|nr:hypothetical protein XA68_16818 [Ophiocordyceps unilateralis]
MTGDLDSLKKDGRSRGRETLLLLPIAAMHDSRETTETLPRPLPSVFDLSAPTNGMLSSHQLFLARVTHLGRPHQSPLSSIVCTRMDTSSSGPLRIPDCSMPSPRACSRPSHAPKYKDSPQVKPAKYPVRPHTRRPPTGREAGNRRSLLACYLRRARWRLRQVADGLSWKSLEDALSDLFPYYSVALFAMG